MDKISVIRELGLYVNCFKRGTLQRNVEHHRCARNAQSTTVPCYIGTLTIYYKGNPRTWKVCKEEIYVEALSVSEQVLLMTCKVKVTTPYGSSTIIRALIDPESSGSFFHERITQYLRLPCRNKNARVEGVAGTTTPTRGSAWYQVCGIENDVEETGVEAYMLRKITKDLHVPLHPIPLALKWGHLSDLKLADSEFRTLARIDLLLGAEVFTTILCDGQRTGP